MGTSLRLVATFQTLNENESMPPTAVTSESAPPPRWLHGFAVLTVLATLPLLTLGAEVTTKQVGMVDKQGLRPPWHMLEVDNLLERGLGYVIEHWHRLVGFTVGTCAIVLVLGLWWTRQPWWLVRHSMLVLLAITLQGVLGIFRIELDSYAGRDLAMVHGLFAEIVFTLIVSLALVTSRWWHTVSPMPAAASLVRCTWIVAGLIYGQLILGAVVRHQDLLWGARAHMLGAFAVLVAIVWLLRELFAAADVDRAQCLAGRVLAVLVLLQLVLGVEALLARLGREGVPLSQQFAAPSLQPDLLRSLHYVCGASIFANAVVVLLQAQHRLAWRSTLAAVPARPLEGTA